MHRCQEVPEKCPLWVADFFLLLLADVFQGIQEDAWEKFLEFLLLQELLQHQTSDFQLGFLCSDWTCMLAALISVYFLIDI